MKTQKLVLGIVILMCYQMGFSQQGINYKALIKDANGNALATFMNVQFTIHSTTETGTIVYQEDHNYTTDANGLLILSIGTDLSPSVGIFEDIDWSADLHFLNTTITYSAGTIDLGTTQFMAVPYAKHAKTANSANTATTSSDNNWQKNNVDINNKNTGKIGFGVTDPKVKFHFAADEGFLIGTDTIGGGTKMMYIPDRHAFRIGTIQNGASSIYWNNIPNILDNDGTESPYMIGEFSFATGLNNRAQGYAATAMGRDTEATNYYAFASGYLSNADGQYSTAMGYNTDAFATGSTALGYSTDAEANYSFAAGHTAEAQAIYSVAIGNHVLAQSYNSTAIGRYNVGGGNATSWLGTDLLFEIGNGSSINNRSNAMTVLKNGNVGIGTTSPYSTLHVVGDVRIGSQETITDGGSFRLDFNATLRPSTDSGKSLGDSDKRWSSVYATNGVINTSDMREKENINDLSYGLNEIMQLKPVSFTWKEDSESGTKLGLVAQDLQKIIKEVVVDTEWQTDEKTGKRTAVPMERLGVYYSDLIPVLIKATQEQQTIIEKQQKQIDELKVLVQAQLNKN